MILWCSFLPFALWEICGWATPFVEAAIAFLLLGIENVGAHIALIFGLLLPVRREYGRDHRGLMVHLLALQAYR